MSPTPRDGPRLVGRDGAYSGHVFPLVRGDQVIGRDAAADIAIDAADVSRLHACVHSNGDDVVTVTDLGSTNGTAINGKPIRGTCALTPGDVLSLGSLHLVLEHVRFDDAAIAEPNRDAPNVGALKTPSEGENTSCHVVAEDKSSHKAGVSTPWLRNALLIIGGLGTIITAFVGLFPILHHTTDHGVAAYQKIVEATCESVHGTVTHIDFGEPQFGPGDQVSYDKSRVVDAVQNASVAVKSEYEALNQHAVPAPLKKKWAKARALQQADLTILATTISHIEDLPGAVVTQDQLNQVTQPYTSTIIPIVAQLDDAMTDLAGAPCKVSTT